MWRRDGRRWRNIRCVGKCASPLPRSSYLFPYLSLSLCLSIQTTVLCTSFHSFLRLFQGSPKAKVLKEERREKSGEREREIESFWARMQSRSNEVRKLPNGERRLLLYSSWVPSGEGEGRGKEKCRLSVAFVATGEWRIRAINPVLSLYVYVQCGSYNHEGVR